MFAVSALVGCVDKEDFARTEAADTTPPPIGVCAVCEVAADTVALCAGIPIWNDSATHTFYAQDPFSGAWMPLGAGVCNASVPGNTQVVDPLARAPEVGTLAAATFNPNMFGD